MKRSAGAPAWLASVLLAAGCGSGPAAEHCEPAALTAALAAAREGDTVRVGACTITGAFTVPPGVTLAGRGADQSALEGADPDVAVVRLQPGATGAPTVLSGLRVESRALGGVRATRAGAVALRDVRVHATEGIGLALLDSTEVSLERVVLEGPVPSDGTDRSEPVWNRVAAAAPARVEPGDPTVCEGVTPACTPDARRDVECPGCGTARQFCDRCGQWTSVVATQGLALVRVVAATLTDVEVRGFAELGVLATGDGRSTLRWTRGTVAGNIGLGLYADGVAATLEDVRLDSTFQGFRLEPAAAAYFGASGGPASVESTGLGVADNRGYGVIHVGAEAHHDALVAVRNRQAAVWAGRTERFELSGATLSDNQLAGIVLVRASGVSITDSVVAGTLQGSVRVGSAGLFGAVSLGDGIQIFDSPSGVSLRRVTLEDNERVGLSLDLGETAGGAGADVCHPARDGVCFEAVTVRGTGAQHGAIAGDMRTPLLDATMQPIEGGYTVQPVASGGWDEGITRSVETDDAAFTQRLEMAGIDGPLEAPSPAALVGMVGPCD